MLLVSPAGAVEVVDFVLVVDPVELVGAVEVVEVVELVEVVLEEPPLPKSPSIKPMTRPRKKVKCVRPRVRRGSARRKQRNQKRVRGHLREASLVGCDVGGHHARDVLDVLRIA